MRNIDIAKTYIKDALIILKESEDSFNNGHYHRAIRKCQEAVELALKGLLRLKGVEYPKTHKIGKVLSDVLKNEISDLFLQKAVDLSDRLADIREASFYGSEGAPAEELFDRDDAREVLDDAGFIIGFIRDEYSKRIEPL